VDFRELISSDEWRSVYKALLTMWKYEFRSAAKATEKDKHLQHKARYEMIEEIMGMPLNKLKGENADLYREKIGRDRDRIMEEEFKSDNHGR
jgi:hypothetical protein